MDFDDMDFSIEEDVKFAPHKINLRWCGEIDPDYLQGIVDGLRKLDPDIEIKLNGEPYNESAS